jgi:DNA modification methylase
MEPWHHDDRATIYHGDCLEVLRELPDASVDSVVTDPPYGLGFMGKEWDDARRLGSFPPSADKTPNLYPRTGKGPQAVAFDGMAFQLWCQEWVTEALRVLKPGGHLLAFGGTRTWHRLAVAVEDAGFEVRDLIAWLYGSGFPKSLDVSKAIDKAAGAEREIVGQGRFAARRPRPGAGDTIHMPAGDPLTAPATTDAARWSGWGTALKPAFEPVVVARKPLTGTVAANVLEHGVGGLNIDGCRIEYASEADKPTQDQWNRMGSSGAAGANGYAGQVSQGMKDAYAAGLIPVPSGRWPANVVLDEDQADALDRQSGVSRSPAPYVQRSEVVGIYGAEKHHDRPSTHHGDSGGASRFFYVAKAPARERPKVDGIAHPTVKPLTLMRWLCRLVTPPGGIVLEPFAGSGTTIEAALMEGFRVVAIEREDDYLPLIAARLERVAQEPDGQLTFDASA